MNEWFERVDTLCADNLEWRNQCAAWATRVFGDNGLAQVNSLAPGDCDTTGWQEWHRRYPTIGNET